MRIKCERLGENDIELIGESYTGEIKESFLEEGMLVSESNVLFTVKSTDYDLQEEQLVSNKENYNQ